MSRKNHESLNLQYSDKLLFFLSKNGKETKKIT